MMTPKTSNLQLEFQHHERAASPDPWRSRILTRHDLSDGLFGRWFLSGVFMLPNSQGSPGEYDQVIQSLLPVPEAHALATKDMTHAESKL